MFRILVADDEGIMRDSIKNTIQQNFGSDCEIALAKTGREVIEQAQGFRPDIAFVDIQMPGLSGIQAIQEIRKFDTSIVFVIITAYDRFGYAQEAVNLGVMEYVMKPVNKSKIIDVCVRAMQQVEEARHKRSADLKVREKLEIVIPMLESAFINNILQKDESASSRHYLEMLDIHQEYGYMVVLEFGDTFEGGKLTNAMGSNVRANKNYANMVETLHAYMDCVVGPIMGNRIVIYVPFEREHPSYEERVEMISRVRNSIRKMEGDLDLQFRGGIGNVNGISDAYISYKDAIRALSRSDRHVVHIMDVSAATEDTMDYPVELESRLIQMGMKADRSGANNCAEEMLEWFFAAKRFSLGDIKMRLLEIILRIEQKAQDTGTLRMEFRHHENYLDDVMRIQTEQELRDWFFEQIRKICDEIQTTKEETSDSVVSRSLTYIKEHFSEEITLDDVARQVDISPYYFSKLFKQEVGENFIEYLTQTRIAKAKEYLVNPKYSIKEICGLCGYSDPNYFSRIFRKYEGISPSEYRG
ncbi:MAG: response regulator [Lachnospiraceae bacterium]|nr:response regulator [Lachnospiraceae bacterium]